MVESRRGLRVARNEHSAERMEHGAKRESGVGADAQVNSA